MRSAALIYGPALHHLDHLAPLCSILDIPLIVTEEEIATYAKRYYPAVEVLCTDYLTLPEQVATHFDVILCSLPRDLFDEVFFFAQKLLQKKIHTVWCPHGNSDKGNGIGSMEALHKEEVALVYGKQMIDVLKARHVFDGLKTHVMTGNYRYAFYVRHRDFFDGVVEREVKRHLGPRKTLLYAPTWRDYEGSSSFFDAMAPMLDGLPDHYNLVVKLHPNLLLQEEEKVRALVEESAGRQNVCVVTHFPLIYPLLSCVDAYIGDASSVGYDFLRMDKPMFFLKQRHQEQEPYLFRCGTVIPQERYREIYAVIDHFYQYELRDFSPLRQEVYHLAFGPDKSLEQLRQEIEGALTVFPTTDPSFF